MPTVEFEEIDGGVIYKAHRDLDDGRHVNRVSTWVMPNVMCVPDVAMRPGARTASASRCRWTIRTAAS